MKKALFIALLAFGLANVAFAVVIDDNITPQNCDRSNASCAQFMDTTSVGQVKWGGFIAGGLRSLTNLFVDGKLGVGTLRPSTGQQVLKVDVEGAVGAKFYCDENGNNCVAGGNLGGGNGTSTTDINLTGNGGITVNESSTNNFVISASTNILQSRVNGTCPAGQAIRVIAQDGTVTCQNASGNGTGDSFWSASPSVTNGIFNNLLGNVGIGTNNPASRLSVSGRGVGEPVAKVIDSLWGNYASLALNGNGAEFKGNQGVYAVSEVNNGLGITGHALGSGETYGGRFIGTKIGSYNKGNIALYAADMDHASVESTSGRDNKIPATLANSSTQWAGYFDGNVNINGKLNVNGDITINNRPISSESKECVVCISAYDNESNTWSTWKCSGANGAESEGTGFSGSRSIEKVKVKMQCN